MTSSIFSNIRSLITETAIHEVCIVNDVDIEAFEDIKTRGGKKFETLEILGVNEECEAKVSEFAVEGVSEAINDNKLTGFSTLKVDVCLTMALPGILAMAQIALTDSPIDKELKLLKETLNSSEIFCDIHTLQQSYYGYSLIGISHPQEPKQGFEWTKATLIFKKQGVFNIITDKYMAVNASLSVIGSKINSLKLYG